jgi:hypothetical protein
MSDKDRDTLMAQQEQLLRCLLHYDEVPDGIALNEAKEAAAALLQKRRRAVERCLPDIVERLGVVAFNARFGEFAKQNPSPHRLGPCADAKHFWQTMRPSRAAVWRMLLENVAESLRRHCVRKN